MEITFNDRRSTYVSTDKMVAALRDSEDRRFWIAWHAEVDLVRGVMNDFGVLVETYH